MARTVHSDNKRLAKNTFMLYLRTIVVMFVSLYVSRLVLKILGVSDYGVYNAVGGLVGMFSLMSASLVAATQRFITFELGKGDGDTSKVFSITMVFHAGIGFLILILSETIGLLFLNNLMNLPPDRYAAANWVLHFSTITFICQLMTIPYNAMIVAKERMGIFALISIAEVFLKLGTALLLLVFFEDKLVYYAMSIAAIAFVVFLMNYIYCRQHFRVDCKLKQVRQKQEYLQIVSFVGWNFLGSSATVLSKQGVSVLLNLFFGVLVNAGRGVAIQVDNAINQFIGSFTTAIRPQITKTYAACDYYNCFRLVNFGTKITMYLSALFIFPLFLRADFVLHLWLSDVPDFALCFTRLSLLIVMMDALSTPLYFLMMATGKIRDYQLTAGCLGLLTFPLTWLALWLGMPPESSYYILFCIDIVRWLFQIHFLKKIAKFDIYNYLKNAIVPVICTLALSIALLLWFHNVIPCSLIGLCVFCMSAIIVIGIIIVVLGINTSEKKALFGYIASMNNKML